MNDTQRFSLSGFALDVFFNGEISFLSATKRVDEMKTLLLVWKKEEGFYTRVILKDPNSDAETTKPLNLQDFPTGALIEAIKAGIGNDLAKQLIEILG